MRQDTGPTCGMSAAVAVEVVRGADQRRGSAM